MSSWHHSHIKKSPKKGFNFVIWGGIVAICDRDDTPSKQPRSLSRSKSLRCPASGALEKAKNYSLFDETSQVASMFYDAWNYCHRQLHSTCSQPLPKRLEGSRCQSNEFDTRLFIVQNQWPQVAVAMSQGTPTTAGGVVHVAMQSRWDELLTCTAPETVLIRRYEPALFEHLQSLASIPGTSRKC